MKELFETFSRFSLHSLNRDNDKLRDKIMDLFKADRTANAANIKMLWEWRLAIQAELKKRKEAELEKRAKAFKTETTVVTAAPEASAHLEGKLKTVESQSKVNLEHPNPAVLEEMADLAKKSGPDVIGRCTKVGRAICGQVKLREEDFSTEIPALKFNPKLVEETNQIPHQSKELVKLWEPKTSEKDVRPVQRKSIGTVESRPRCAQPSSTGPGSGSQKLQAAGDIFCSKFGHDDHNQIQVSLLGKEVDQSESAKFERNSNKPARHRQEDISHERVKCTWGPRSYDNIRILVRGNNGQAQQLVPTHTKIKKVVVPTSKIARILQCSSAHTNLRAESSRWCTSQTNSHRTRGQTGRRGTHLSRQSKDELESVPFRGGVPSLSSVFMGKEPDPARQKRLCFRRDAPQQETSADMSIAKVTRRSTVATGTLVPPSSPKAQALRRFSRERVPPDKSTWTPSSSPSDKLRRLQCPF